MKIYLIAGKSGSGKNTVAQVIQKYYQNQNQKVIITEYSKYLKLYAKEILNWAGEEPKPRKFLQDLGVTIRDNLGEDKLLVNRLLEDILVYKLYFDIVIISDVRYPEEITEIKAKYPDTTSIYVINQFAPSKLTLEEQMHITEIALEEYTDFDLTIINDDLTKLPEKVYNFLNKEEIKWT